MTPSSLGPPPQAINAGFTRQSFYEDFTGPLDIGYRSAGHKWQAGLWWQPVPPSSSFSVSGAILTITANATDQINLCTQYYPGSGTTAIGAQFLGGYFEAMMQCTDWSAFWLFCWDRPWTAGASVLPGDPSTWTNELDIVETDQGPSFQQTLFCTLHKNTSGDGGVADVMSSPQAFAMPAGSSPFGQWHKYGLLWTQAGLTWYVDDVQVATTAPFASTWQPVQLIITAQPGGNAGGSTVVSPPITQFQWVRAWSALERQATPGTAVGSGALITPGGQQGIQGPTTVSADAGNIATLGSDNLILVPQSQIWSARLRSFNAIGNPTFEVDQRNVGNAVANPASGTLICDRWLKAGTGTYQVSAKQNPIASGGLSVPGTNFKISANDFLVTLTTAQASLGAGDFLSIRQQVEGIALRELIGDVHSLQLMVWSTVAPLKFSVSLRDAAFTRSLVKLCTYTTASTWQLIPLPNLPVWDPGGTFNITPGLQGYDLAICLAAGSGGIAPAADVWQTGTFVGAPGMDSFVSKTVNSQFAVGFVQHEPGSQCTTPIDLPFAQNLDACLRYYAKSYDYTTAPGTATSAGLFYSWNQAATQANNTGKSLPKIMAKDPASVPWNHITGASNSIRDVGAASTIAVTAVNFPSQTQPWQSLSVGSGLTVNGFSACHYTADTGW